MDFILENWEEISLAVGSLITAASVIIRLTPSSKDDAIFNKVVGFFSALGLKAGFKVPFTPIKTEEEK